MWNGIEIITSCKTAEKKNTTNPAFPFVTPLRIHGK